MKRWLVGLFAAGLCAASAWAADCALETAPEGIGAGNSAVPGQEAVSTGRKAISVPRGAARQMTIYVINLGRQSDDDGDSDEIEFGDAILVESGGEYFLMDTGAAYTRDSVIDYLKAVGVTRLAGVYLSHLHSDHMGNYDAILEEFQVDRVYLPDTSIGGEYVSVATSTPIGTIYHSLAQRAGWNGAEVVYLQKGSTFSFGTVAAEVLGPAGNHSLSDFKADKYGSQTGHYLNNCSLSAKLVCGKTIFLTCGDIEQEEEEALLAEYGKTLKAGIFKLNHHGLLSSNGEGFIEAVRPVFSFLSNNGYEGTTTASGNTVTKHHTIIERMQKYGIPYMLGNEGKPVIYKVENDAISMYRDKNGNGQAEESERFKDGWNSVKGISMTSKGAYNGSDKYYFVDGKPVGGIRKIDGKWYHFADGGALQKGLYKLENGKWVFSGYRRFGDKLRYYNPDGTVTIGFANITNNGKTYLFYFDDEGYRVNGDENWTPIGIKGKKYALNANGVVYNNGGKGGLKAYGTKYRYFGKTGVMATGWKTLGGTKYYFDPETGYRCTGLVEIGDGTYYFSGYGKLVTGRTVTVSGKTVTLDENGKVASPKVGTVKGVTATSKDLKNKVKWKKVSGAKGYIVCRATKKAGTYKVVKTVADGATVKFTDKKVKQGKKYYYKVCAYKKIGKVRIKGKPSSAVSVTVPKDSAARGVTAKAGFTVPFGSADSVTAAADNGVEPYAYVWRGDLSGEGATLAIPADLAPGDYTLTVTATDSSETPQEATASISFTVAPVYSITIDPAIVGGTVVADKETAAEGELVTLTVTPDPGFDLVAVFVNGGEIEGTTFEMPAGDVTVSAGFAEVVDYATLPFIDKDTPYPGPWKNAEVPGLTNEGLDNDYDTGGVYGAKFRTTGAWMQVKFRGTPGTLSFGIKGNGVSGEEVSTFVVRESADGETWTPVAVFTSDDNLVNSRQDVSYTLSEDSRYVQFLYQEKVAGNVGIYDVYIGEAGEAQPTVTVDGETTLTLGSTFALELALENYTGGFTWAWAPETVGYVDPETATWWWTPTETQVGETEVTFSAMDGDRTIASATVTLTVAGEPAEPEVTLVDGGTTVELGDYFLLEFALSNYEGAFTWTADVGEIDGDGYFTWAPTEPGEFPVVVSAMSGEETIASTTVTLTVTGEPPAPVPARIAAMEFDMDAGILTLKFIGDGTAVYGTDDLNVTWEPLEALIDGDTAIVQMTKRFIRVR